MRWLPRFQVMTDARQSRGKYLCNKCKEIVGTKEFQIGHKEPVVPVTGWDSWDGFISRLFCPKSKLQLLCKPCHKAKSKKENGDRK